MNQGLSYLYRKRFTVPIFAEPDLNLAPSNCVNARPSFTCEPP